MAEDNMRKKDSVAWIECDDIITRIKDELILEAVDILHEEIKAGHVDINGYVSLMPDKPNELQRDMYIINNILEREHEIMGQYGPYLDRPSDSSDSATIERIEHLRKFILSVQAISTLMRLSRIAGAWSEDTGKYSEAEDVHTVMVDTMNMDDGRVEVADFVLSSKRFASSEALSNDEIGELRRAREAIHREP